jgi:DNA-binding transcriptional MerR regulator
MTNVNEESNAHLSIGEFARRSRLSISALRFYGDCGVLVPARIDGSSGYRFYAAHQLREATLLRHLRALEMPIAEIRSFLTADPIAARVALDSHWKRLEQGFDRSRSAFAAVQVLLSSREESMPATTTLDSSELARGLRQVLPAAGHIGHDHRYPAAVLVDLREDGVRLVATDGHRLAVRDLPSSTFNPGRIVIDAADAERLASIAQGAGPITLSVGAELGVRTTSVSANFTAVIDHYPDYEAILARCGSSRLLVSTAALIARLDRNREMVVLNLAGKATSSDGVAFPATYDGDDLTIAFNPSFLADALAAGIGPEAILQLGSSIDPVAIRSADDGTLTCLVMPIRLKDSAAA